MRTVCLKARRLGAAATMSAVSLAAAFAQPEATLPAGLDSPDHGVVCNRERAVCYDRYGPSIGLTEVFLGGSAAKRLTASLREPREEHRPGTAFSPAEGVECVRETGPCRVEGKPHAGLIAVLYGPPARRDGLSAEARAILGAEWHWLGTRYNNDTERRPTEPAGYTLRLERDGSVRVRADCNEAGGLYRLEGSRLTIQLTQSTLAACEPGSLE